MYEIGKKDEVVGSRITDLTPLNSLYQRPSSMPYTNGGRKVICGFDQGLGERMIVCESLQDMQELYDKYYTGWALRINWYQGEVPPPAKVIDLPGDYTETANMVNDICPNAPKEVCQEIVAYARGNFGAGKALATLAVRFGWTSPDQVREWVGWPLSEYSAERAVEIWDRFNR